MNIKLVHEISLDEILSAALKQDSVATLESISACFQELFKMETNGRFSNEISTEEKAQLILIRDCQNLTTKLMNMKLN
jgi:hypothetical protein